MIVDTLENAHLYATGDTRLAAALEYLQQTDFSKLEPGQYEVDGENVYALVQHYDSRPEEGAEFEGHRAYGDVHFVCDGTERLGYRHIRGLTATEPYDEEKECEMLKGEGDFVTLVAGMFAVVYPEDAHMPSLAVGEPAPIRKVVVKFRVH